ncbi:MAG TPA: glutamine amidotransferase, partial [Bacteroidota bacterium]|nr:glutamine amidotransferase [Bacteroidota bacterium]
VRGIDWSTLPALLGFNETSLRPGCESVLEIENQGTWYPLLAARPYGKGRVTCWTTGASPHWGINFMKWREYPRFWKQVFIP